MSFPVFAGKGWLLCRKKITRDTREKELRGVVGETDKFSKRFFPSSPPALHNESLNRIAFGGGIGGIAHWLSAGLFHDRLLGFSNQLSLLSNSLIPRHCERKKGRIKITYGMR